MTRGGPWPHIGLAAVAVAAAAVLADPAPRVEQAFRFTDSDITESSGLAVQDGLALTVNDSGGDPVVYAVDPGTGDTVGRTTYTSDEVEDVEALAVGPDGTVWVGDIGDNGADRASIALYAVPSVGRGERTVEAPRYDLTYRSGPRDAETLLVDPRDGRLYVVSKGLFGGGVFAVPTTLREDGTNVLRPVGAVDGLLTDGVMTPDGTGALLRGYGRLYVADTDSWRNLAEMPLPHQRQGEGLTVPQDLLGEGGDSAETPEAVLVSSEGARTAVLAVPLADTVIDALEDARDRAAASTGPRDGPEDPPGRSGPTGVQRVGYAAAGLLALLVVTGAGLALRGARRRSRSTR